MNSSEKLADAILSGFGGPAMHIRPVKVLVEKPVSSAKENKFAPKGQQIDDGLERLMQSRREGQTFSQEEIAAACGCHRRNIQFIERRAVYKFTRRLLAVDPELVSQSLGDGVKVEDILRIHHPESSDSGKSRRKETDFRWQKRARRNLGQFDSTDRNTYETAKMLRDREPRFPFGRRPTPEQMTEIRAERMRKNKETSNVNSQ